MKTFIFVFSTTESHSVEAENCWKALSALEARIGSRAHNHSYFRQEAAK